MLTAALWIAGAVSLRGWTHFGLNLLPAPDLGVTWRRGAVLADSTRQAGLDQLLRVLIVVAAVSATVGLASFAFRMSAMGVGLRRSMAIRGALGASIQQLMRARARDAASPVLMGAI